MPRSRLLSIWISLGVPVVMIALQLALRNLDEETYRALMRGELGLVENLTVVALLLAAACGILLFRQRGRVRSRWFGPFALVMTLGCLFFAGEETSWGQHWFAFETPAGIAERNEQGEFNLHNDPLLETVLDQLPRNLLTLFALVGGVLAPLLRRRRARPADFAAPGPWGWIWPAPACMGAAFLAVAVTIPEKVLEDADGEVPAWIDISAGETKELCLAVFLLVYLWSLHLDLRAAARATAPAAPV